MSLPTEDPEDFITVYQAVSGWKAVQMTWCEDSGIGMWEPWTTGVGSYETEAEAVVEAKAWAEDLEVLFKERGHEPRER